MYVFLLWVTIAAQCSGEFILIPVALTILILSPQAKVPPPPPTIDRTIYPVRGSRSPSSQFVK